MPGTTVEQKTKGDQRNIESIVGITSLDSTKHFRVNEIGLVFRNLVTETLGGKYKSPITDSFNLKDGKIIVKLLENSSVLQGHLKGIPLIPGVLQKQLVYELNNIAGAIHCGMVAVKTKFGMPMLPGSTLYIPQTGYSLQDNKGRGHITIETISGEYSTRKKRYYIKKEVGFSSDKLDNYLLQTGEFRFVSGFSWLRNKKPSDPKVGDTFQGYFQVPTDFPFQEKTNKLNSEPNIVSPCLLEEFAAQIGSISFGDRIVKKGKTIVTEKNLLLFNNSICKYSGLPLNVGNSFRLVGKIKSIGKRTASFEYVGYDSDGNVILEGEITGTFMSLKTFRNTIKRLNVEPKN